MSELLVTDIAGALGGDFLRNVDWELRKEVPKEKLRHFEEAAKTAALERKLGIPANSKLTIEGIGQRKLHIPQRTFFRWNREHPGCWQNKEFVDEFYRDNPECRN